MLHRYPVGNTRSPADGVEDVAFARNVRLWDSGHDGSLWVHPSAVINIPPVSGNISTAIQTHERGLVPITVSQSGRLVGLDYGWLNSRVRTIICVSPEWVHDTYL